MSRTTKIWLIVAGSLVLIGCILFVCVMFALDWDFKKLSTVTLETNTYEISETFSDISLSTSTADITFVLSEDGKCRVECYEEENAKHSVAVEAGVLTVGINDQSAWYDHIGIHLRSPEITVYLPKAEYTSLSIRESTGNVTIPKDCSFGNVDISASTGHVDFSASVAESVKIKTSTGHIRVENTTVDSLDLSVSTGMVHVSGVTCRGKLTVGVSTGKAYLSDIACDSIESNGSTGDITLISVIADNRFSIERSTGNVTFSKCDAGGISIKTSTGDVTGSLRSGKVFITRTDTGDVRVPETTAGGRCEIHTDTGNIEIEID